MYHLESMIPDAGVILALFGIWFVVFIGFYVWYLWSLSRLFPKIGLLSRDGWIPIWNQWKLIERGGLPGWLILLGLVPGVSVVALVVLIIAMHRINTEYGKGGGFTVLGVVLPPLWAMLLTKHIVDQRRPSGAYAASPGQQQYAPGQVYQPQGVQAMPAPAPAAAAPHGGGFSGLPPVPQRNAEAPAWPVPAAEPAGGFAPQSSASPGDAFTPPLPSAPAPFPSEPAPQARPLSSAQPASPQPASPQLHPQSQPQSNLQPQPQPQPFAPVAPPAAPAAADPYRAAQLPSAEHDAVRAPEAAVIPEPVRPFSWPGPEESAPPLRLPEPPQAPPGSAAADQFELDDLDRSERSIFEPVASAETSAPQPSLAEAPTAEAPAIRPQPTGAPAAGAPAAGAPAAGVAAPASAPEAAQSDSVPVSLPAPQQDAASDEDDLDRTVVVVKQTRWGLRLPDGEVLELVGADLVLGRKPESRGGSSTLQLTDPTRTVSKSHVRMRRSGEEWTIEDLDSTNGVSLIEADGALSPLEPQREAVATDRFVIGTLEVELVQL